MNGSSLDLLVFDGTRGADGGDRLLYVSATDGPRGPLITMDHLYCDSLQINII